MNSISISICCYTLHTHTHTHTYTHTHTRTHTRTHARTHAHIYKMTIDYTYESGHKLYRVTFGKTVSVISILF